MRPLLIGSYADDFGSDGSSGAPEGRTWFVSPVSGSISKVFVSQNGNPDVERTLSIQTAHGTFDLPGLAPIEDGVPYEVEVDRHDESNFVRAGEAFSVRSSGEGSSVNTAGIVVEIA